MATIHYERPDDRPAVREVNELAFGRPAEAELVDRLRERGKVTLSLVAVENDQVVGHILFSRVRIGSAGESVAAVGLAPMAVLPAFQNRGIGSQLVRNGLDECRRAGCAAVVVLGHPHFYPRFGFVPASRYDIRCEYQVRDEVFMAIELQPGALANCTGIAKYETEFNSV